MKKRCELWFCFRRVVGVFGIFYGDKKVDQMFYCKKHEKTILRTIKPDGMVVENNYICVGCGNKYKENE